MSKRANIATGLTAAVAGVVIASAPPATAGTSGPPGTLCQPLTSAPVVTAYLRGAPAPVTSAPPSPSGAPSPSGVPSSSAAPSTPPPSASPSAPSTAPTPASPSPSVSRPPVRLCVSVRQVGRDPRRGQEATFTVTVWTQNGAAPNVKVSVRAAPASAAAGFTRRCPAGNGTATCQAGDLGAGDTPGSDQFQVKVKVPARSAAVTLTATVSTDPALTQGLAAAGTVRVIVPQRASSSPGPSASGTVPVIAPLPGGQITLPASTGQPARSPGSISGLLPSIAATRTAAASQAPPASATPRAVLAAAGTVLGMNPVVFYLIVFGVMAVLSVAGGWLGRRSRREDDQGAGAA